MGKTLSTVGKRAVRNWNVENRAHRALDKSEKKRQKRVPDSFASAASKEEPKDVETFQDQKSAELHEWLKKVKIESTGPPPEIRSKKSQFPENRGIVQDPEFGYMEPDYIPKGRITIRQALDLIGHHQEDPELYNKSMIASEYKLDEAHVHQILKYYKMYNLKLPQNSKAQKLLNSTPSKSEGIHKLLKSLPVRGNEDPDVSSNKKR